MADIVNLLAAAAGAGGEPVGYQISRSLRFNSADSAYLSRTPAGAGNRKTWTWSGWVKRSQLSSSTIFAFFGACNATNSNANWLGFVNDSLAFVVGDGASGNVITSAVYRDTSAWQHIVFVYDSGQATSSNRQKIYVNGVLVTSFSASTYVTQNLDGFINNNVEHNLGARVRPSGTSLSYFNGYLAEVHFVDGQALTPSDFGETDATTGVWKPKAYAGTYGTNGFYLNFSDNTSGTTLGYDYSGNSNNWTTNNFSVTAGAGNDSLVDTPTPYGTDTGAGGEVRGNYCTWNPLANNGGTITNGSLDHTGTTALTASTLFPTTGKWYCELTCTAYGGGASLGYTAVGVIQSNQSINTVPTTLGGVPSGLWIYRNDAYKANNGVSSSYGNTWTANDVIGIAIDLDAGKLWFSKNGTWQASGDPAAGTNEAYSNLSGAISIAINDQGSFSTSYSASFGQRPFTYTAPSGFKALCTQNLPDPTVVQGDDYFNTVLYTGTGSSQSITGVGFQPDWVWIKERSGAADHGLYDAVRGVQNQLESNTTTAETTESTGLTAFGTDGFTVGSLAQLNTNTDTYVAWNWNAGGSNATNTDGTITSTVRANPTAGFSIVSFTATGAEATTGHGLSQKPDLVITKARGAASANGWYVHTDVIDGSFDEIYLNQTSAKFDRGGSGQTATTIRVLAYDNGVAFISYCFHSVEGYSRISSYVGNGSTDGPFVYCGFRPAYIILKSSSATGSWCIYDTKTGAYNVVGDILLANSNAATNTGNNLDILSNGFKLRNTNISQNTNGTTYIFMAFAENPFKYSLAR